MVKPSSHNNRHLREQESGAVYHSWNEQRYRVALVYPNTYHQGMSNLGFLTVYHLINQRPDCLCERFFLPAASADKLPGAVLASVESDRPLRDFDLVAFSISFENDYLNLPPIFELAQIPLFARERSSADPLVLLGGVCAFINPEPLADIVDLVAVGEAEPLLPALLATLQQEFLDRDQRLLALAQLPGIYVPRFYRPEYSSAGVSYLRLAAVPQRVKRQYLADLESSASRSFIQAQETEFGHMSLTEVSRGCSRGCRFCAAGFVYLPVRERSLDNLFAQVDEGLCQRSRIGLVAAAVADYSDFVKLQQGILARQGEISVSSLRLDALDPESISLLQQAGHSSIAIAPEAGSQRMRDAINKGISAEQILAAVKLLADSGIKHLKLYFLIGLPREEMPDIDAIVQLVQCIADLWREGGRKRRQLGQLTVSVNPFIPKPFTPLQWSGMESEKILKKKGRYLQSACARIPNTKFIMESVRLAILQAFLSRGDRRVGALLPELSAGTNLKQVCARSEYSLTGAVTRARDSGEAFPWEIIDSGVRREYLWREYERASTGRLSPPCAPDCQRCGIC